MLHNQFFLYGTKIQALQLLLLHCLLTICVCTSVGKKIFHEAKSLKHTICSWTVAEKNEQGRTEILLVGYGYLASLSSMSEQE